MFMVMLMVLLLLAAADDDDYDDDDDDDYDYDDDFDHSEDEGDDERPSQCVHPFFGIAFFCLASQVLVRFVLGAGGTAGIHQLHGL